MARVLLGYDLDTVTVADLVPPRFVPGSPIRVDLNTDWRPPVVWANAVRNDPVGAALYIFGIHLWEGPPGRFGQADALRSFFERRRTVVPSGHATGKTWLTRIIPPLWLISHPYSYFILTGQSWTSVEKNLVPGIRAAVARQPYLFPQTVMSSTWTIKDGWAMIGISPLRGEPAQGWHSVGGTGWLADEASAVTPEVFSSLNSLLTGPEDHGIMCGNPTNPECPFADAIRGSMWHTVQLRSIDTPNCRAGREVVRGLATREMVQDYLAEHGEDSAEYRIRCLGELPDQGDMIFIPRSLVLSCGDRPAIPWHEDGSLVMGVDVAWSESGDESVFLVRGDTTVQHVEAHRGLDLDGHIFIIEHICEAYGGNIKSIHVDGVGVGTGLCDRLLRMGIPGVVRVINSARAHNSIRYANTRSESWGTMKQAMQYLSIPKRLHGAPLLERIIEQACGLEYYPTGRDQIQLEPKDKYRKRTGKNSPDWADALAMTFARRSGNPAFPMADELHCHDRAARTEPIDNTRGLYNLRIDGGWEYDEPRPGMLCRAMWFSHDEAAVVWMHVDQDGCWAITDTMLRKNAVLRSFWATVLERSGDHRYKWDLISTPEASRRAEEYHIEDLCSDLARGEGYKAAPYYIEANRISGALGLEQLRALLLSTLSRSSNRDYWHNNPHLVPAHFQDDKMIVFHSRTAFEAVASARMKEIPATQTDLEMAAPEGLINDGGAIVRCLRMFAVAGINTAPRPKTPR